MKIKNGFVKIIKCFSNENVLTKHKEDCLSINGKQSVNLEKGIIEIGNYQFHLKFMLVLNVI